MSSSAAQAFSYLVGTLIDLFIGALLVRVLLQAVRADFYNPVSQFIVRLTNPVLNPLRRFIPAVGRLDTAAAVLIIVLEIFGVWILNRIAATPASWPGIVAFSATKLAMTLLMLYFFLIIAAVIVSWLGQGLRHPFVPLLFQLTEPVLQPFRRLIPPIAGLDLSPLFALIAIRFLILLLGW